MITKKTIYIWNELCLSKGTYVDYNIYIFLYTRARYVRKIIKPTTSTHRSTTQLRQEYKEI